MNSQQRSRIKRQIQGYLEKHPQAELRQVREWLLEGNQVVDLTEMNPATLKSFIFYQIKKFHGGLDVTKHAGNNGRPQIAGRKQGQIVFMSDLYKNYNPVSKNMNGAMYADLVRGYAAPAVEDLYPEGDAIWQDDPASIHRCAAALAAVNDSFNRRLDHEVQCPKFSDVWPIENVWGIVKERVSQQKCETLAQLKRAIIGAWRSINEDRALVVKLMSSIPVRCRAVVESGGNQVH